ncbi:MAG: acyltransferase family protein [Candidatus Reddybacter sp.]
MHPAYRPEIDGLRALAVVSVLIFHLNPAWLPGGFIGVDIFFVISGFLITSIISKELRRKEFSFSAFYARRAKRIFPALFTVLILCSLFAYISLPPDDYKSFFKALRYVFLQFGNVHFSQEVDYFAQGLSPSPLLHTWSLGVEEQFYLLWPLLLALSYKWLPQTLRPLLYLLALVSSLIASQILLSLDAKQSYYMVYSRGWELLLGGLLAFGKLPEIRQKRSADMASIIALLVMLGCMLSYAERDFPGLKALLPVAAAALFIHSANLHTGLGHRLLSSRPTLIIGLYSYSLYLWHWPLISFTKTLTGGALSSLSIIIITLACFLLAALTYKFVEQPFLKIKASKRSVIIASLCFIISGAAISNVLKHYDYHPSRSSHAYDLNESMAINTKKLCKESFKQTCTPYTDGSYDILLAGDSHGAHYASLILNWAKAYDYRVKIITQGGCPTWLRINQNIKQEDSTVCREKKQTFTQVLSKTKKHVFLAIKADQVSSNYGVSHGRGLDKIVNPKLKGHKVTLLLQIPLLNQNPNDCLFNKNSRLAALISPLYKIDKNCIDEINTISVGSSSALLEHFADTKKWRTYTPSPLNKHFINSSGKLLYKDEDHLNIYGNTFLSEHFMAFTLSKPKE